jgi:predicted enzyme related to lactoylglutathione lyase
MATDFGFTDGFIHIRIRSRQTNLYISPTNIMSTTPAAVQNALNWFEIYVNDIAKASKFYSAILNKDLPEPIGEELPMVLLPGDYQEGVGGALTKSSHMKPGSGGTVVYLNVEGDLDGVLSRIPAAGGNVVLPRKDIAPHGFIGVFTDIDGNTVGLHSLK